MTRYAHVSASVIINRKTLYYLSKLCCLAFPPKTVNFISFLDIVAYAFVHFCGATLSWISCIRLWRLVQWWDKDILEKMAISFLQSWTDCTFTTNLITFKWNCKTVWTSLLARLTQGWILNVAWENFNA